MIQKDLWIDIGVFNDKAEVVQITYKEAIKASSHVGLPTNKQFKIRLIKEDQSFDYDLFK